MRRRSSGKRAAATLLVALSAAVLAIACSGCGGACDTSDDANPPTRYAGGTATGDIYESSPWKSGLLPFSGGKQYELEHHLGFTPAVVQIYIAFGSDGERVATCAGNSCLTRAVDDQVVWIKNDTCADFWVRVVAFGREPGSSTDAASVTDASRRTFRQFRRDVGPIAERHFRRERRGNRLSSLLSGHIFSAKFRAARLHKYRQREIRCACVDDRPTAS